MKRTKISFVNFLLFIIFVNFSIIQAGSPTTDEIECKNVTLFRFYYTNIILSKDLNTIETPRKWMEIIKDSIRDSSNPHIDNEKLATVYKELEEKLLSGDSKNKSETIKIVSISFENSEGIKWRDFPESASKSFDFYLIVFHNITR